MKSRIQIIDDNVALTTLLAKALARFGYDPVVENNPLLAVNTVRHYMPDLILLDVMMPEKDGGRVLFDLRNDLSLRYIPVILLTAIAREAQTLAGMGGIQSTVLAKPVQLQELLAAIDAHLKAGMTFNQLQDAATGRASHHNPALNELPDFEKEVPWTDGDVKLLPTPNPPSTSFAADFPALPAPATPAAGAPAFAFPERDQSDSSRSGNLW